jgi:murein DD-endopeptidase MepM/ murein hydrolase activator NlpD
MNGTRTLRNLMFAGVMILAAAACLSCSSPAPPTPTSTLPPSLPTPAPTLTPTPADTPTPEPLVYVVESGDTLSDIASRFGTTVEAIMDLNGLTDTTIYSGTELRIPAGEQPAPAPTEAAAPTPAEQAPPTPTVVATTAPVADTQNWQTFCQASPQEEGKTVANLPLGGSVQIEAHLYVKSFSMMHDGMMPFTLREKPYQSGDPGWADACQIHLLIPVGTGPNHTKELPKNFQMGQVVVWDASGREIQGWQRSLDSFRVRVIGVVVEPYGGQTGLDGSNTVRLEGIHLLES